MNIGAQVAAGVGRRVRPASATPAIRLPVYLRLMLVLLTAIVGVVLALTVFIRLDAEVETPDSFSAYTQIFPGQPRSAVVAQGLSCGAETEHSQYCTQAPASGPFSLIAVTLSDGLVMRVNFTVRENALLTGDLPLAWGRPSVESYRDTVDLTWPNIGVCANARTVSGRFGYFLPVLRISSAESR